MGGFDIMIEVDDFTRETLHFKNIFLDDGHCCYVIFIKLIVSYARFHKLENGKLFKTDKSLRILLDTKMEIMSLTNTISCISKKYKIIKGRNANVLRVASFLHDYALMGEPEDFDKFVFENKPKYKGFEDIIILT